MIPYRTMSKKATLGAFIEKQGGVSTVSELADFLEIPESNVRRWARRHNVRRCGSTFVFDTKMAQALQDALANPDANEDAAKVDESDRPERFTMLLSRKERLQLDRAAAALGMTRSTYVRARIFLDAVLPAAGAKKPRKK